MKNFAEEYLQTPKQTEHSDPYLFKTPEVEEEIHQMQMFKIASIHLAHMISVLITAPITTITASLQLSVKPHKNIFEEPISKSTQLAKTTTSLTLQ